MKLRARLNQLRPADFGLLPTALLLVVFVRLSLSILPFAVLRRMLDALKSLRWRWLAGSSSERAIWMVKTAARFVPGATCLTQALAIDLLYAFRGEAAEIHFGIVRSAAPTGGRLEAHAWVESGGTVVLGAPEAGKFTPLLRRR